MTATLFNSYLPEIFFSCAILFQLIFNVKIVNKLKNNFPVMNREIFSQTFFILGVLAFFFFDQKVEAFSSTLLVVNNEGAILTKFILTIISIFTLILVYGAFELQKLNFSEYFSVYLLSILALLLMISAGDLLFFYLTMEMQALCFYILASFNRNNNFSAEAGLKYFIASSFVSGIFLLGCSIIYGALGTVNLYDIHALTTFSVEAYSFELYAAVLTGSALIFVALLFKLGCAPFHFWIPDAYEGAPLASTIVFSIVPKLSLIVFFMKFIISLNDVFDAISPVLFWIGVFSCIFGALSGLHQIRLKRLIIYSSISQTGFIVSCLSVCTVDGFAGALYFLFVYLISSMFVWGLFVFIYVPYSQVTRFESGDNTLTPFYISSFANIFHSNSTSAGLLLILFFSIAGIPPFTGFTSKMLALNTFVNNDSYFGPSCFLISSAIATYYYIRMVKVSFFEPRAEDSINIPIANISSSKRLAYLRYLLVFLAFLLCFIFLFPNYLHLICHKIVLGIFGGFGR